MNVSIEKIAWLIKKTKQGQLYICDKQKNKVLGRNIIRNTVWWQFSKNLNLINWEKFGVNFCYWFTCNTFLMVVVLGRKVSFTAVCFERKRLQQILQYIYAHENIVSVISFQFFSLKCKKYNKVTLKKKKKRCQYKPNSFAKIISQPFIFLIPISPTSSCTDRKIPIKEEIRLVSIKREINIYFINWKEKKKKSDLTTLFSWFYLICFQMLYIVHIYQVIYGALKIS